MLRGVMVMMVVVMVMAGGESGWAGKHREEQNYCENLFHGWHPSRIEQPAEALEAALVSKEKRGPRAGGRQVLWN